MIQYYMESLTGLFDHFLGIEFFDRVLYFFSRHIVFNIGLLLIIGYTFGKIVEKLKLPAITGYIAAGLFMGESFLNLITQDMGDILNSITDVALSIIALTIGAEFRIVKLKKVGTNILILTVFEAVLAFIFVTIIFSLIGMDLKYSLILGAVSAATAPAATVVIIKELRARGTFIDYLYGVVAFDDAVCVILFGIIFSLVSPILTSVDAAVNAGFFIGLFHALKELFLSILIGLLAGIALHLMIRKKYKLNEILIISVSIIFLNTALAMAFQLSPLIANMVFGAVLVNLSNKNKKVFSVIDPVTPPLFALFFILAGTELNVTILTKSIVVIYGVIYIAARFSGKMIGIYIGSQLTNAPEKVKKFLGLCLFPQAGVAIGLVLFVKTSPVLALASPVVKETIDFILNIVLLSVFLNELIGPSVSRYGIIKGGEL